MLSVCSTAPMQGIARYASRWRCEFHANVATRSPSFTPSDSSAPASRSVRSQTSEYFARVVPSPVSVTISLSPKTFRIRPSTCWRFSGKSCCTSPSSISPSPIRSPDRDGTRLASARVDLRKLAVELAAALEPVVPSEVTLSVEGPTLYLSLAGTASWTQADLRSMYDWDADALVEWVLDGFQTDLAELTTEPWPAA